MRKIQTQILTHLMNTLPITHINMIVVNISVFLISLFITGLIIPKILLIAFRKNLFDEVDERKIHHGRVPRLGGIAFVPAIIFSFALVLGFSLLPQTENYMPEMALSQERAISFGVCGLMLLYLVGVADDLVGVLYRAKFVVQIIAACFLVLGGVWINNLHGFCGVEAWPDICGCMLTMLVCVFFVNAINLIDGIDGLASGLSSVALIFYGIVFAMAGDIYNAMISFATLAALMQFFYYNVFGSQKKRKKIFMGDTGALCIGYIITYLSVIIARMPSFSFVDANPIVCAFAPMLVPCLDVLRVFFNRIRNGVSPFMPDKTHIHHKMLNLGMSTPRAMISILLISILFVVVNVFLSQFINAALMMLIDIIAWLLYNWTLTLRIKRYKREAEN